LWNKDPIDKYDLYEQKNFDLVLFDEINNIECDGETLIINHTKKIHLSSTDISNYFVEKLEALRKCQSRSRKKLYEKFFKKSEAIKQIQSRDHSLLFLIQFLGMILFIYTFIFLPFSLYVSNLTIGINIIIFNIISIYLLIIGLSLFAHKRIYKNNEKFYLFLFSLLLSPVSSIHALHAITKDIALNPDWIIQSADLLSSDMLKKILIKEIKRVHLSKGKSSGEKLIPFLQFKESQYFQLLKKTGLTQDEVFAKPNKKDLTAFSYCPFCETDFLKGVNTCPDCNLDLLDYDDSMNKQNEITTP